MDAYRVARLDEIGELDDGRSRFRPVRHHLGITAFGVNAWTGRQAGDRIINEHDEAEPDLQEELYLVLCGRASFELGDDEVDAPAGTFVFVRPGVMRTAFATEPSTTVVAIGAVPGKPYEPGGWEVWAPLGRLYNEGKYEEAADQAREVLAGRPPYAQVFYNVACCESLAGRKDDALEHLRRAIELSEGLRSLANSDSDLDPIRNEPAFEELVAK